MCERVRLPNGGVAIVCGGRRQHRRQLCVNCREATAMRLCDHRTSEGLCNAPICDSCALSVPGKNRDYCQRHAKYHHAEVPTRLPFEATR